MKKNRMICLFLACLLLLSAYIPVARAEEIQDQSVFRGCHSVDAQVQLSDEEKLLPTSKAAMVYELSSDTMIYAWNPDQRVYPSSMVKLMTVLVALEHGNLTDKVVVTKRALSYVEIGSTSAGLSAGEELTLKSLLYLVMTASANDAATVVAEHIGGTQDNFIKLMNEKAEQLGCQDTHYSNAHGLHDEQTYTTVRDICRILDVALDDPVFYALFTAEAYTVEKTNKSEPREIHTTNYMMSKHSVKKYFDERVTGGKTGSTDEAGRCLAATSEGKGMKLLTIVMGAEATYEQGGLAVNTFGSFEETKTLIDYALTNFEFRQVFSEGQSLSQYPVQGGINSVVVQPVRSASTILPVGLDTAKLTWIYTDPGTVTAPVEKGQTLSAVQVWYGAKCLAQSDLVAAHRVMSLEEQQADMNSGRGSETPGGKVFLTILLIVLGLAALGFGGIVAMRWVRVAKLRAIRRRRRANRRRNK